MIQFIIQMLLCGRRLFIISMLKKLAIESKMYNEPTKKMY